MTDHQGHSVKKSRSRTNLSMTMVVLDMKREVCQASTRTKFGFTIRMFRGALNSRRSSRDTGHFYVKSKNTPNLKDNQ